MDQQPGSGQWNQVQDLPQQAKGAIAGMFERAQEAVGKGMERGQDAVGAVLERVVDLGLEKR